MNPARADSFGISALVILIGTLSLWAGLDAQTRVPPWGASGVERTIAVGGRQRTYLVRDFALDDAPAPLVIMLHGGGGNADNAVQMSDFDRVAARERFIVVYPNGTVGRGTALGRLAQQINLFLTWNAGHCCASAMENKVDDVGFITAIVDTLTGSGRVDPARVYVTGMSNGAMMTHRLGRELSLKVAAIAPVVGAVFGDEPPPQAPVPAFIIVGEQDQVVPPAGGPLRLRPTLATAIAADRDVAPALDQAAYWARHNGCGEPTRSETAASSKTEWTSCTSGAPVIFHSVKGNGHAWPGGRAGRSGAAQPTAAFNATDEMWAFFARHRRAHRVPSATTNPQ